MQNKMKNRIWASLPLVLLLAAAVALMCLPSARNVEFDAAMLTKAKGSLNPEPKFFASHIKFVD